MPISRSTRWIATREKEPIPNAGAWGDAGTPVPRATQLDTRKTWATNVSGARLHSRSFPETEEKHRM